ncbi:hypothetical protein Lepto7376_2554 [[Leptolyngbya] sp. PCC 7376]|uniref:PTPA-CTERM sorting domain-containing protein n=1 Tax=[Leptolyngbya] sp. PCC 7376 TaxID=111781 RepID=UPI00029EC523|nr:PTPA-CTERM sorting domain-containing protein [[Leptolyngbya] sp. PCC 7376]AFY38827.1 hypothetical protein Lepto7376_2554 [[Leptolyngbya] sp. PCC 7376]
MFKATTTQSICLKAIALSAFAVGSMLLAPAANALVMLESHSLNTNSNPDANSDWFGISFEKNALDGTVTFEIENKIAQDNGTKISTIYFGTDGGTPNDDTDGFFKWFEKDAAIVSSVGQTNYSIDWSPTGGSQINNNAGWGVQIAADPAKRNKKSTITPGDTLSITFNLMNPDVTEEELALAFTTKPYQELGLAYHVQSIGSGYSEWYEAQPKSFNPVPTPAAILPTLAGIFGAASKRKKDDEQVQEEGIS